MEEKREMKQTFKIVQFNEAYIPPTFNINKKDNFVEWGSRNDYPRYLADLYNHNGSTSHKAIINKKVRLTTGYGYRELLNEQFKQYLDKIKFKKLLRQIDSDLEIYNGFCFEVIPTNDGTEFDVKYIPFSKIRVGVKEDEKESDYFWYSKDWALYKKEGYEPIYIKKYDPTNKKERQLYYYKSFNLDNENYYPIVNYSNSLNYIELDYQISTFHLNQVKQGFAPSFILNFATGIPSTEEMDEFYKDFKRNYSSAENAGKIIITYSEGADGKPELIPIQLNDSDERFVLLQDMVEKNIVIGHEIPPQLIILTPGKLGSTEERQELMVEFQNSYITPRQEEIEDVFNELFKSLSFSEPIKLKEYKDIEVDKQEDLSVQEKAQAELKGSVGGVQGILSIQQSVSEGFTTIDAGAAILELIYGIDAAQARRMLGEPIQINTDEIIE